MRRRVEVFIGPFGSGKTEVAINRGFLLAAEGTAVAYVDLDLVDPFFRARQVRQGLAHAGISVVAPEGEWEGADLPMFIPEVFGALGRPGHVLVDVGGEAQGAIVLRQVRALLPEEAEIFLVVNPYRPVMGTPVRIAAMCETLEEAADVRVTGLVSVPHLGEETTLQVIRQGHRVVAAAATLLDRPIRWIAVQDTLAAATAVGVEVLPLRLYMRPPWEESGRPGQPAPEVITGGGTRGQDRH